MRAEASRESSRWPFAQGTNGYSLVEALHLTVHPMVEAPFLTSHVMVEARLPQFHLMVELTLTCLMLILGANVGS